MDEASMKMLARVNPEAAAEELIELKERIQELEQQLREIKAEHMVEMQKGLELFTENQRLKKDEADWQAHHKFLDEEINELYEQVDRYRKALERYGEHEADCAFYNYAEDDDCTCGFEQVLEEE